MGRVRKNIKIKGNDFWTLFDVGSRNTYVVKEVSKLSICYDLEKERQVALGGRIHHIKEGCILIGEVEGFPIEVDAYVIDRIGEDEEGKEIKILLGALAMQKWGIRPLPDEEKLDMSNYPKEFLEFREYIIYMP